MHPPVYPPCVCPQFAAALATTLEVCREAGAVAAAAAAGGGPSSVPGSPVLSLSPLSLSSPPEALSVELLRKESLAGLPFAAAAKVQEKGVQAN
jgi:hypothetical protein